VNFPLAVNGADKMDAGNNSDTASRAVRVTWEFSLAAIMQAVQVIQTEFAGVDLVMPPTI